MAKEKNKTKKKQKRKSEWMWAPSIIFTSNLGAISPEIKYERKNNKEQKMNESEQMKCTKKEE